MTFFSPSIQEIPVPGPGYLQIPDRGLLSPLVEGMKDVDAFAEPCYIEHPMLDLGVDSDLLHARPDACHGLPVVGLQTLLYSEELEARHLAGSRREGPDVTSGRPEPQEGLVHLPRLYKYEYRHVKTGKGDVA
jgi:hypothetical protein